MKHKEKPYWAWEKFRFFKWEYVNQRDQGESRRSNKLWCLVETAGFHQVKGSLPFCVRDLLVVYWNFSWLDCFWGIFINIYVGKYGNNPHIFVHFWMYDYYYYPHISHHVNISRLLFLFIRRDSLMPNMIKKSYFRCAGSVHDFICNKPIILLYSLARVHTKLSGLNTSFLNQLLFKSF